MEGGKGDGLRLGVGEIGKCRFEKGKRSGGCSE